ncbi:methyltransferase domain-containing protein [Colletotrichum paranaense]|uniref:Methyltransferase domain-containing protein n=1 Tax=Colletotrichum paranaense TaxID=1914294 RepID=A0ABQ9S8C7_9PEZI|nr:methyltransferase domain-containing protein [Colletotrichum paranaense]KAK1529557.1 methyltransferase domain-containing protein [Colletotrichum paranaense]
MADAGQAQQTPEPDEVIEAQEFESDASSTSGTSVHTDTDTLRTSIRDYRRENGRTYHSLSDGTYILPNDAYTSDFAFSFWNIERTRPFRRSTGRLRALADMSVLETIDFQHHFWTLTWDGKLCMCPKNQGANRVLDIGTGTGIWAEEYADKHSAAVVIGVDLSPIQPEFVPPNCKFEVDDVEKEWTWQEPFDFIFARHMNACFESWERFLRRAYDALEPGGFIELQDNAFPILCQDGTLKPDDPMARWSTLMMEGTELIGRPITVPARFRSMLSEAGFVDVVEHKRVWPTSPWPLNPELKELGVWGQACSLEGIEPGAMALFTRVLGWTREEVVVFMAGVRDDFKNTNIHGFWNVYSVYGMKPYEEPGQE